MDFVLPFENSEQQFIDACVRNERWAQKQLYEEHYPQMMGVCLRYANNEQDALDILQEGFIKIFDNISKFKFQGSLEGWMKRIVINTALEKYRKEKVFPLISDEIEDEMEVEIDYLHRRVFDV